MAVADRPGGLIPDSVSDLMYVPGDKYRVFYSMGEGTIPEAVFDTWQDAKASRNEIFSRPGVRAAWVMKDNPSQNTVGNLYGNTLRRTKHEMRA